VELTARCVNLHGELSGCYRHVDTVAGVRALKALRLNMSSDEELPLDMQRALLRLAARELVSVQRVSPMPNSDATEHADEEDQRRGKEAYAAA
jgi:hypothetical protein